MVFLPLPLLTGVTGVFFRSLALTMAVALLTSLVLALFFTPVLAERFVKVKRRAAGENDAPDVEPQAPQSREEKPGRFLGAVLHRYEWMLAHSLDNRWLVIVVSLVVLAGSYLLYRSLGTDFLPAFDESAFVLDYQAPAGASLAETDRMLRHVEELLLKTPEVESYSRRTGMELGLFITEPNTGDFAVKLKPGHERSTAKVEAALRGKINESEPSLGVEFVGILPDMLGDLTSSPEPIEIKLFSEDTAALEQKAVEVEEAIQKIEGVVDTKSV